jgi:ribose transport system permease protein
MGVFISFFIRRYSGFTFGIVVGVISMKMLTTAMVACGMSATVRTIVNGLFLLVLLCISSNQNRFIDWRKRRAIGKEVRSECISR